MNLSELNIPQEVKDDIAAVLDTLLEKFSQQIRFVILFGSYAKNKYQPDSDVDIAVVLNTLPEKKERRTYYQAVDFEREIDLLFCTQEQLDSDSLVYKSINEQGVVIYEQL